MVLPTSPNNAVRRYSLATELFSTLRLFGGRLKRFYEDHPGFSPDSMEVIDPNPPQPSWFRRRFSAVNEQYTKDIMCWMVYDASLTDRFIEFYVEAVTGDVYIAQRSTQSTPPKQLVLTDLLDYSEDALLDLLMSFSEDVRVLTGALNAMH
jgi:hypothetical protein